MVDTEPERIRPGERAVDRDSDDEDEVIVLRCTGEVVSEATVKLGGNTIAELNPHYPADDAAVVCVYPSSLDMAFGSTWYDWTAETLSERVERNGDVIAYTFPESRLKPTGDGDG